MTPRALRGMAVNEVGRARISMMVRSMSSHSRPDTLVQDRTPQPHGFLLQRTAGPYIGVKRFQTIHPYRSLAGSCFSPESAHRALPSWDSRTRWNDLLRGLAGSDRQVQPTSRTHLIHRPARDTIPPPGGARFPPTSFGFAKCSRSCSVSGPAELGAVDPDTVHDHGQSTRQCDDRLFHSTAPGDLHCPCLEPGPFLHMHKHALGRCSAALPDSPPAARMGA